MKDEILIRIKEELEIKKAKLDEHNQKVKRLRELQKDKNVKEFLELSGITYEQPFLKKISNDELIASIYSKYLYLIRENETNGLYIYLGTYAYNDEIDVVHGSRDYKVSYDSPMADYRLYQNIEQWGSEHILISKCDEFEKIHTIINPKVAFSNKTFYTIQRDFFVRAVKVNQELAKKMVLRKYSK